MQPSYNIAFVQPAASWCKKYFPSRVFCRYNHAEYGKFFVRQIRLSENYIIPWSWFKKSHWYTLKQLSCWNAGGWPEGMYATGGDDPPEAKICHAEAQGGACVRQAGMFSILPVVRICLIMGYFLPGAFLILSLLLRSWISVIFRLIHKSTLQDDIFLS